MDLDVVRRTQRAGPKSGEGLAQKYQEGDGIACVSRTAKTSHDDVRRHAVGAAHVPLYEQQKPSEWKHVLEDSGAKLLLWLLQVEGGRHTSDGYDVVCFEDGGLKL